MGIRILKGAKHTLKCESYSYMLSRYSKLFMGGSNNSDELICALSKVYFCK